MATRRPHAAYLKKPPTALHEGFAEFITKGTGHEVTPTTVGLVQRLYPVYLKSPAVQKAKAAEKAEREREAAEKKAAKDKRLRDRLARIEEDRRKLLAELGIEEDDLTDEAVTEEPEEEPTPAPKKATKRDKAKAVVVQAEDRFTGQEDDDDDEDVEVTIGDAEQDEQDDDDLFEDDDDEEDW